MRYRVCRIKRSFYLIWIKWRIVCGDYKNGGNLK